MAARSRGTKMGRFVDRVVSFFVGEWILNWSHHTVNGGTVVAARTAWLTAWIYIPAFVLRTTLSVGKVAVFDFRQGLADLVDTLPWLAAIFAGIYTAFYTRFSSQWTYLAGLYNQIMQAHLALPTDERDSRMDTLAAWKAGFIEDAEDLHLAAKPMFLVAVRQWGTDTRVAERYSKNTVGGQLRLKALLDRLELIAPSTDENLESLLPPQGTAGRNTGKPPHLPTDVGDRGAGK